MANMDVLGPVERRRVWSAEEKAALLAEIDAEGGRVRLVERRHGLSESLLYNWRAARKAAAAFNIARHARLDGKSEDQAVRLVDPQGQTKLLRLCFLTPKRPHGRFLGESSIKPDGYILDKEDEMVAVVHDGQPRVHARGGRPSEALLAKGIGAASD